MRYAYQAYMFLQFIDFARFCGSDKAFTPLRQKQRANKNTGVMPVFFYEEVSNAFNCGEHHGDLAEWLCSIISRTIPGQGHGNQYYPGGNGMCVTPPGVMSRSLICHSSGF